MKKIFKFAAALAVILPVSCNKEIATPEVAPEVGSGVPIVMSLTTEDLATKVSLVKTSFDWEIGDVVNLRWANVYTDEALTASFDSEKGNVVFAGEFVNEIPIADAQTNEVQNLYAYYAKDGGWYTSTSVGVVKDIPAAQTGKLEDIDDNVIFAAFIPRRTITPTIVEGKVTELALNADMRPYFSILKFTVPADLALTSITLSADVDLVGNLCINSSKITDNAHNNIFGTGAAQLVNMATEGRSQSIVISRGGEIISGDVYVVVAPNEYNSVAGAYGNSAESLKFTLTAGQESYEFESSLSQKLLIGELKDLGTIPVAIKTPRVEAGAICMKHTDNLVYLQNTNEFTISISNPNPDCTYYYEVASSASACPTPTTSSNQLDLTKGLVLNFTDHYTTYFVKVLAHYTGNGQYRDVVMKANARYWVFNKTSPTAAAYRDAANSLANNNDHVTTSDGLVVYRRATAALTYTEGSGSIEYNNCIVPFMQVERSSDVYICISTSDYYNNKTSKAFNLFYTNNNFSNINRVNTFGDFDTSTSVVRKSEEVANVVSVVWHLGELTNAYKLAFAPDSKMTCYGQGILEVL